MSLFYYYYHLLTGDSYHLVLLPVGCLQLSLLEVIALDECLPDSALQEPLYRPERAQKAIGDIEKYFFADQEMLRKKSFESAEERAFDMVRAVSGSETASGAPVWVRNL
jgi:hypothetical protein